MTTIRLTRTQQQEKLSKTCALLQREFCATSLAITKRSESYIKSVRNIVNIVYNREIEVLNKLKLEVEQLKSTLLQIDEEQRRYNNGDYIAKLRQDVDDLKLHESGLVLRVSDLSEAIRSKKTELTGYPSRIANIKNKIIEVKAMCEDLKESIIGQERSNVEFARIWNDWKIEIEQHTQVIRNITDLQCVCDGCETFTDNIVSCCDKRVCKQCFDKSGDNEISVCPGCGYMS